MILITTFQYCVCIQYCYVPILQNSFQQPASGNKLEIQAISNSDCVCVTSSSWKAFIVKQLKSQEASWMVWLQFNSVLIKSSSPGYFPFVGAFLIKDQFETGRMDLTDSLKKATCSVIPSLQRSKAGPNLEPDGVDYLAEDEQRENPESTEDGGQDEL